MDLPKSLKNIRSEDSSHGFLIDIVYIVIVIAIGGQMRSSSLDQLAPIRIS